MKLISKAFLCSLLVMLPALTSNARIFENPVSWNTSVKHIKGNVHEIRISPSFSEEGWHIYDLGPYEGGPVATSISIEGDVKLLGEPYAEGAVKSYDDIFEMEIGTCSEGSCFVQRVESLQEGPADLKINIEWQACNDGACVRPETFTVMATVPGTKNGHPVVWMAIVAIVVVGGVSLLLMRRRYCR